MFDPTTDPLSGAVTPAPQPSMVPNSPDLDPSSPMNSQPNNAPAPAQAEKPSMWKNILQGALVGLAGSAGQTSFGGGMGGGAKASLQYQQQQKENALEQQKQASDVKFRDLQAASTVAEIAERNARIQALPQQQLDAHNKATDERLVQWTKAFGKPTGIIDTTDNGENAMQHMKDQTALQGGVGHVISLSSGSKTFLWDTDQIAQSQGAVSMVRGAGTALGLATLANMTDAAWKTLTPEVKRQYLNQASDLFAPTVPDSKSYVDQLKRLQSSQRMLKARVSDNPGLQDKLDQVNSNIELVQSAYDQSKKDKEHLSVVGRVAGQNARLVSVVDSDGNLVVKHAGDAIAAGDAPAAQGDKAMGRATQLQEMQVASRNLRTVVEKLQPFTATQLMQVKAALSEASPGMVADTIKAKLANEQLTPEQQDFVVWAGQMQERAMALRSASGIGQQGSDKLRAAIVATLPNEKDTKELRLKKLNAFDNQVSILMRGVPGVGRGGKNKTAGAAPAAPAAKPKSDPLGIF